MVAAYEECRKQRLEENKTRMEELNLFKLSQSLKTTQSPKTSPLRKVKPRLPRDQLLHTPLRRSSRVADKAPPNYKEYTFEAFERCRRIHRRRDLLNRAYASDDDRIYAVQRAEDMESSLDSEFPRFVKPMLQSHVTGGFWLGLPVQFCKTHLPDHDDMITLVDEDGGEWETKYLAGKTGLSGGWRGFSIDHELVDGDALVFQLIRPTKFKVYIVRVNSSEEVDEVRDRRCDASEVIGAKKTSKRIKAGKKAAQ
ncbi:hypothetical protein Nepgr_004539 [Nepenthes gracilis]|uniref:TF-B3 domain-containing protein n=1 Tax=Nepenthes gracilis TaxID=150966 RepID=A0AAD3XFE0_NEPGR|nr:hypothetical protein Nepgr_004539 [Nepenthes gracilis]